MSEVAAAAPAAGSPVVPVEAAEGTTHFEHQDDGSAEGQRGELLPEAAAEVLEEQIRALGKKKIPLKVNGRDIEYEVDMDNDAELSKYFQKAMAADEKFQEAATIRKQMQQFVQALKTDPLSILQHPELGINVQELAEMVINQQLDQLSKSPEQKRMEQLERDLADREEKLKSVDQQRRDAEMSRLEEQAFQELDRDIDMALKETSLPKSGYVLKRIADTLINANEMGYTDVTVKDIMPFIEATMEKELQEMFGRMPEEVIERMMGTNLDRVRKAKLAKAKKVAAPVRETAQASAPKPVTDSSKTKVKAKDFFNPWK